MAIQLLRTIIVEPQPEAAHALAVLVGSRGHNVTTVSGPTEALPLLRAQPIDLVLVRLNHLTAQAVAELLAELATTQPSVSAFVLALTDGDEPVSRVEAWMKRGIHDFMAFHPLLPTNLVRNRLAIAEHMLLRQRTLERRTTNESAQGQRYEEIFLTVPEATLIVTARDGFILEANPAAEQILGVSKADLENHYLSLVLPDLFDHEDFDPQVLGLHDAIHMEEVPYTTPSGTERWLGIYLSKIIWPQSQAFLLQLRDVTAAKARQEGRVLAARQAAAGHVMLGVARELSDSLTTMRGNLELLARLPSTRAESRELIASATVGCEHVEELGRRMTGLGRRQQGLDVRRQPLALTALLEKSIPFALLGGNCRPAIEVAADLWPVEADEAALTETLINLVDNAAQAMPQGGQIVVRAQNHRVGRTQIPDETGVLITLRDQGAGISAESLPRIFDPFYSTTGREGMGLAHAAATVLAHGGRLTIATTSSSGTQVDLWLPVNFKNLLVPTAAAPAAVAPPDAEPTAPPARPRVLFMDDEAQIRVLVHKVLTAHGFDVYCTKDGQEAIDVFRKAKEFQAPFDVLLFDLDVRGGMGGQEAVARLHAENPNLKALLTTGYIDDALLESHQEHGFLGVIPKPFQLERLVGAIAKLAGVRP